MVFLLSFKILALWIYSIIHKFPILLTLFITMYLKKIPIAALLKGTIGKPYIQTLHFQVYEKNYAYFQLLEFGFCIFVAFIFIRMVLECSDFVFCSNLLYLNKNYLPRIFIIYVYFTNVNKSMALRPTYDSKTYQGQGVYDLKKSCTKLIGT